jgi:hypothetical protein
VLTWLGVSPISDIVELSAQVTYQTVPPVNTPDPEGFFSVTPPLNPCSDGTHTLPDGGYQKHLTFYKIDAAASVTGACNVFSSGQYAYTQIRWINVIKLRIHPPSGGPPEYLPISGPWPATQSHDTRNPGSGGGSVNEAV